MPFRGVSKSSPGAIEKNIQLFLPMRCEFWRPCSHMRPPELPAAKWGDPSNGRGRFLTSSRGSGDWGLSQAVYPSPELLQVRKLINSPFLLKLSEAGHLSLATKGFYTTTMNMNQIRAGSCLGEWWTGQRPLGSLDPEPLPARRQSQGPRSWADVATDQGENTWRQFSFDRSKDYFLICS